MRQVLDDLGRLECEWDTRLQDYTFSDGSRLPEEPDIRHPRTIWAPTLLERPRVRVCVQRIDRSLVWIAMRWRLDDREWIIPLTLRVSTSGEKLMELCFPDPPLSETIARTGDARWLEANVMVFGNRIVGIGSYDGHLSAELSLAVGEPIELAVIDEDEMILQDIEVRP